MGVGVIARDAEGFLLASMCATLPFITDPIVIEARAIWKTVIFYGDLRLQWVNIEGDALEILQALRKEESCWSLYRQLIMDTQSRFNNFRSWYVWHIRREANEAVHCLAKVDFHQYLDQAWKEDNRNFI